MGAINETRKKITSAKTLLSVAAICLLLITPLLVRYVMPYQETYILYLFFLTLLYITLAASWNLHAGYAGVSSFGNIAFFGVGVYTVAILVVKIGIGTYFLNVIAGGILAAITAVVFFYPALKLRGPFFVIITLVVLEVLRELMLIFEPWTGGGIGLTLPISNPSLWADYYAGLLLALAVIFSTYKIVHSKVGLILLAVREDEDAAEALGVNPKRYKMLAWTLAAFFSGMAGGLWGCYTLYINPYDSFGSGMNFMLIFMAIIGGVGTILGPAIGAAFLMILSELTLGFQHMSTMVIGFTMILIVLFMREGIVGLIRRIKSKILNFLLSEGDDTRGRLENG